MSHKTCIVPSWFPSFLETQVESAHLQFCHQARARQERKRDIFTPVSLFLTSLLPTGKCRHPWKEWRWYRFSVFAGCQEWRHKALGHFESDFPHSRVLSRSGNADESKYQYSIHVQYVSCASRFLFTITICDLMLLFFCLVIHVVTWFVWWLKQAARLNSNFSSHCRYSTSCDEKAVDVMKTEWLMTNSLCPRLVHIL
jgi:hypothetical protein